MLFAGTGIDSCAMGEDRVDPRGADQAITDAIDAHVQDEQAVRRR